MFSAYFIVYDSRSGSTMVSNMLSKWMNTYVIPESQLPIDLLLRFSVQQKLTSSDCDAICEMIKEDRKINDWGCTEQLLYIASTCVGKDIKSVVRLFYSAFFDLHNTTSSYVLGIKKESYLLVANQLKSIFTDAKFLCVVRDPRGVFASKKRSINTGTGRAFEKNPVKAGLIWSRYIKCIVRLSSLYPGDVLFIKYENILNNEEKEFSKIASFLGVDLVRGKSNFYIHERYSAIHSNVGHAVLSDNNKKWRKELSDCEVYLVQKSCSEEMAVFKYHIESVTCGSNCNYYLLCSRILISIYKFYYLVRSYVGSIRYENRSDGCFALKKSKRFGC